MARFLHPKDADLELSLQDVFLLQGCWEGGSRREVDLTPPDFLGGSHPLVSANMNAVTGKRLAETLARYGGLGVLPQDIPRDKLARIIARVREADMRYDTPLTIRPDDPIRDVRPIIFKRESCMAVVIDGQNMPVGVFTPDDFKDQDGYELDEFTPAGKAMSAMPVVVTAGMADSKALATLVKGRVKAAPVVDDSGRLVGTISRHAIATRQLVRPSLGSDGKLMVAVAIGINGDPPARATEALSFGADVIVLDTAHGYQRKMLDAIRAVRSAVGPNVVIVAGNVCTRQGTEALIAAGASGVKVNVGPGAMCTTRMVTGVGRPTFSAVRECAEQARSMDAFAWADGGVKEPRDMVLYLAAGASRVMAGTLFTATFESPPDMQQTPSGELYKGNYGMASRRAVGGRRNGLDELEAAVRALFNEGISSSKVFLRVGRESVGRVVADFVTGAMSAGAYVGARTVDELWEKAVVGVQTQAGFHEGTPHGRVRR